MLCGDVCVSALKTLKQWIDHSLATGYGDKYQAFRQNWLNFLGVITIPEREWLMRKYQAGNLPKFNEGIDELADLYKYGSTTLPDYFRSHEYWQKWNYVRDKLSQGLWNQIYRGGYSQYQSIFSTWMARIEKLYLVDIQEIHRLYSGGGANVVEAAITARENRPKTPSGIVSLIPEPIPEVEMGFQGIRGIKNVVEEEKVSLETTTPNYGIHYYEGIKIRKIMGKIFTARGSPIKDHHYVSFYSGLAFWVPEGYYIYKEGTMKLWDGKPISGGILEDMKIDWDVDYYRRYVVIYWVGMEHWRLLEETVPLQFESAIAQAISMQNWGLLRIAENLAYPNTIHDDFIKQNWDYFYRWLAELGY